ncbi:hypothetical protein GWO61_08420 [Corynebacterium macginleyi]|uniref:hypothetical protein n=1 Tax=Corynebacterium macginleyi TaxID=38290 RepID=UPI001909A1B5|nr:hypothetical protein [Corynebacterium macginleyi]MBK4168267.1 hypothetical protein [Corynebacterium macginleyi]
MKLQKFYRKSIAGVLTASLIIGVPAVASAQESTPTTSVSNVAEAQERPSRVNSIERVPVKQVQLKQNSGTPDAEAYGKISAAVKAALAALKKINKGWYDKVVSKATEGKTAFVNWWNASVPGWVKALFGNIAASAIWEVISTYLL